MRRPPPKSKTESAMQRIEIVWLAIVGVLFAGQPRPATAEDVEATQAACLQVLLEGLASDQFWPSMHAAEALTMAGHGAEVIEALSKRLDTEEDDQHRCGLARELFRAGNQEVLGVFSQVLRSSDTHGHGHACESLFKIGQTGDKPLLMPYFTDDSQPIKQLLAAAALANGDHPTAKQKIRALIEAEEGNVAGIAAWILAVHGDASDIDRLRARRKQIESPKYRFFFTAALAMQGDQDSIDSLQKGLQAEDPAIRGYAAEFCGRAGIQASRDALLDLLQDEDLDVRIRAAQSLLLIDRSQGS
ncbi:HEAT repeat domain-containing protein [Bremerella sp. JC770]|uniref:HEAT repeat domain-containing protein n=1 Tax=Bremerella sp. JC770 TaxID=3232137 RepID=UPI003459A256